MAKSKLVNANKKLAKKVAEGYQAVEDAVVDGYMDVQTFFVNGYRAVEDKFVDEFLTEDGESVEAAKKRLKEKQNAKH